MLLKSTKIVLNEIGECMLKLSKLTDYATVILSHMATDSDNMHTAQAISEATGITQPTVSKVLKLLLHAKVLNSVRGAKGGYLLARKPEDITIATIICALEGPIALTECSLSHQNCEQVANCQIQRNWDLINQKIHNALESISLADLVLPIKQEEVVIPIPSFYRP